MLFINKAMKANHNPDYHNFLQHLISSYGTRWHPRVSILTQSHTAEMANGTFDLINILWTPFMFHVASDAFGTHGMPSYGTCQHLESQTWNKNLFHFVGWFLDVWMDWISNISSSRVSSLLTVRFCSWISKIDHTSVMGQDMVCIKCVFVVVVRSKHFSIVSAVLVVG